MKLIFSFLVTFGIIVGGTDFSKKIIDTLALRKSLIENAQTQTPIIASEKTEQTVDHIDYAPVDLPRLDKIPELTVSHITYTPANLEQRIEIPEVKFDPDPLTYEKTQFNPPLEKVEYYENVEGDEIQSPTRYEYKPQGATALCYDGTYSFSRHRRGTCSHHGGVKEWLR